MGRTPDRKAGPREEEELILEDQGPAGTNAGDPVEEGAIRKVGNTVRMVAGGQVVQLARWQNPPTGFDGVDLSGIVGGQALGYNATTKVFEPQTAGGITATQHRNLDQLVHDIAETSFDEITRVGFQVTNITTWDSAAKITKIREVSVVYTGFLATQVTTTQYDAAGVAAEIVVEDITYSGFFASSVTRTKTL